MENSGIFKSMKHSDHLIVTEWDFSYIVLKEVEWNFSRMEQSNLEPASFSQICGFGFGVDQR